MILALTRSLAHPEPVAAQRGAKGAAPDAAFASIGWRRAGAEGLAIAGALLCAAPFLLSVVGCTAWQPLELDGVVVEKLFATAVPGITPATWALVVVTVRGPVQLSVSLTAFAALRVGDRVRLLGALSADGKRGRFRVIRRVPARPPKLDPSRTTAARPAGLYEGEGAIQ